MGLKGPIPTYLFAKNKKERGENEAAAVRHACFLSRQAIFSFAEKKCNKLSFERERLKGLLRAMPKCKQGGEERKKEG